MIFFKVIFSKLFCFLVLWYLKVLPPVRVFVCVGWKGVGDVVSPHKF